MVLTAAKHTTHMVFPRRKSVCFGGRVNGGGWDAGYHCYGDGHNTICSPRGFWAKKNPLTAEPKQQPKRMNGWRDLVHMNLMRKQPKINTFVCLKRCSTRDGLV